MGVPAFFRWLSRRYPMIISNAIETEEDQDPVLPNPNTFGTREFDALYLDMNSIIHACFHPEGRPPPNSEEEIFSNVELYIMRLFNIVRPRRLVFMAIDGVAPRAKMNQQRARRYRAAKSGAHDLIEKLAEATENGDLELTKKLTDQEYLIKHDSNVITPGTPFFARLALHLRAFIRRIQTTEPAWAQIAVILSDASVPGEGEHKIMNFVRSQRLEPGFDPNTRHIIYGLDADLIFLGLASHEMYFTIIRENVLDQSSKNPFKTIGPDWFHFVNIFVLRQYLERDLHPQNLQIQWNLECAIDDFIFLCFSAGNDFLPELPGFSIHTGAVDKIIRLYKNMLPRLGSYITMNGGVDFPRFIAIMKELTSGEAKGLESILFPTKKAAEAQILVNQICNNEDLTIKDLPAMLEKRKAERERKLEEEDSDERENVRETKVKEGLKEEYYMRKFGTTDRNQIGTIVSEYTRGMVWVLRYYLKGVPSWEWFYPYHSSPCPSDWELCDRDHSHFEFEMGAPFPPLYQLMAVLPPQSSHCLPPVIQWLMKDPKSPLAKFYPSKFEVDLNGSPAIWKGSVHVPFIDQKELLGVLKTKDLALTGEEEARNRFGSIKLFLPKSFAPNFPPDGKPFILHGPLVWGALFHCSQIEGQAESVEFSFSHLQYKIQTNFSFVMQNAVIPPWILDFGMLMKRVNSDFQKDGVDREDVEESKELPLDIPGVTPGSTFDSRKTLFAKYQFVTQPPPPPPR